MTTDELIDKIAEVIDVSNRSSTKEWGAYLRSRGVDSLLAQAITAAEDRGRAEAPATPETTIASRIALDVFSKNPPPEWDYRLGAAVKKIIGSSWHGYVVGYYQTSKTRHGICVESRYEPGAVQLYPQEAFEHD